MTSPLQSLVENDAAFEAFEAVMLEFENHGSDRKRKELLALAAEHGWSDLLQPHDRAIFNARTGFLNQHWLLIEMTRKRRKQVDRIAAQFLVYRAPLCNAPWHKSFHNVALPIDHEFWDDYRPANGWGCSCDVAPAISERHVSRITKGSPKPQPIWWRPVRDGQPAPGLVLGFERNKVPSIQDALALISDGRADLWDPHNPKIGSHFS